MRLYTTTLLVIICCSQVLANDTSIVFRRMLFASLFETAKRENKGVMLYFHFDGCGACYKMEKTAFKDSNVIKFFNTNFINYGINTRTPDGSIVNKTYKISSHPTFIFYNSSGTEVHRMVGLFTPEEFYKQANDALYSERNLTTYNKRYKEGNRQPEFLYEYAYMLRDAHALDSTVVNDYLNAIDIQDYSLEKNIRFIYEFAVHNYKVFIPVTNPRFQFIQNNKQQFYRLFDSNQVDIRIVWILNSAIYDAIENKDQEALASALSMLKPYDIGVKRYFKEIDGRTTGVIQSKSLELAAWLSYYDKIADTINYRKTAELFLNRFWNDADELNEFAWNICEQTDTVSTEEIRAAINCSVRSIALKNNYANNDTYACLLYRSGDTKKALIQAKKAIALAKKEHEDYGLTQLIIDKIKQKK